MKHQARYKVQVFNKEQQQASHRRRSSLFAVRNISTRLQFQIRASFEGYPRRAMSLNFRRRTRSLACLMPGVRSSSGSTCGSKRCLKVDEEVDEDDRSHLLTEENEISGGKPYDTTKQEEQPSKESLHPLNDTISDSGSVVQKPAMSPAPAMTLSDSSSADTWPEMTQSFAELDMDQSSVSSLPSSLRSASFSAPNSPFPSTYSTATSSLHSVPSSPVSSNYSVQTAPTSTTPTRSSRLPLTSPLPRRYPNKRSQSTSDIMMPLSLAPQPCEQVQNTLSLLKSIKQQIKSMKRRESHLSTKLHVQRRERQQMQDQIANLESRRLRLEAMFVRPVPLVLLLPVASSGQDEYDLCLVSEGKDAWNALQSLARIQLAPGSIRGRMSSRISPLLLHFGPTLTQPMAASVSFLPQNPSLVAHWDLQPLIKHIDFAFWDRTTCGKVLEADINQLGDAACQFLFDALMERKSMWRDQLIQVVDKKTRRIQWILQQEADSLYYEAIPSSPAALSSTTLAELD